MDIRQGFSPPTTRQRSRKLPSWPGLLLTTLLLAACGGSTGISGGATSTAVVSTAAAPTVASTTTNAPKAATAPAATAVPEPTAIVIATPEATTAPEATAVPEATIAPTAPPAPQPTAAPAPPSTGTIVGTVTDRDSGAPLAGVYIVVGYKGLKLSTITDAAGYYIVNNVPAGLPADVFGFTGRGYRYHNSIYDDNLKIVLTPGETYTYNFATYQINDPAGEPQVTTPSISTDTATPGQQITFSLSARGGKGGLSDEVFAASPQLGRLALLTPTGGDTFSSSFTVPAGTPPGDYEFAFFAASNECYDNADFPKLTLHVTK